MSCVQGLEGRQQLWAMEKIVRVLDDSLESGKLSLF